MFPSVFDEEGDVAPDAATLNLKTYKNNPEWKDIQPVESVDGDQEDDGAVVVPVVSIIYSEKFKEVFSYVWAIVKSGELSPRVLELTGDAIRLDVAHYTVWQLRRDTLQAVKVPHLISENGLDHEFEKEFAFTAEILKENPKNYQPWQHQMALVSWAIGHEEGEVASPEMKTMSLPSKILEPILKRELKLTEEILNNDPKNYHAWQHRQWILRVFKGIFPNLPEDELVFVKTLLEKDVRNNSAWNQRNFVFVQMIRDFSEVNLAKEISETWKFLKVALSNESAWSYLRSVINLADSGFKIGLQKELLSCCKLLLKTEEGVISSSVQMMTFYIDVVNELLCAGEDAYIKEYAGVICLFDTLTKMDPIRTHYWEFAKQKFMAEHAEVAEQKTCCQPT
ncbi:unnamed protein product [Orchesella dallaii]|uniref:Protein farnesyltransferase/geranylgeranyltransferase type-1 subunit alpha n=1 Tax=Orchesella dallaii TaxID=48710 RepID=A0ABP1QCS8_9HEXA